MWKILAVVIAFLAGACVMEESVGKPEGVSWSEGDIGVDVHALSCEEHYAKCINDSQLGYIRDAPNKTRCHTCLDRCQKEDGVWPDYTYFGGECRYWLYPLRAFMVAP